MDISTYHAQKTTTKRWKNSTQRPYFSSHLHQSCMYFSLGASFLRKSQWWYPQPSQNDHVEWGNIAVLSVSLSHSWKNKHWVDDPCEIPPLSLGVGLRYNPKHPSLLSLLTMFICSLFAYILWTNKSEAEILLSLSMRILAGRCCHVSGEDMLDRNTQQRNFQPWHYERFQTSAGGTQNRGWSVE